MVKTCMIIVLITDLNKKLYLHIKKKVNLELSIIALIQAKKISQVFKIKIVKKELAKKVFKMKLKEIVYN